MRQEVFYGKIIGGPNAGKRLIFYQDPDKLREDWRTIAQVIEDEGGWFEQEINNNIYRIQAYNPKTNSVEFVWLRKAHVKPNH